MADWAPCPPSVVISSGAAMPVNSSVWEVVVSRRHQCQSMTWVAVAAISRQPPSKVGGVDEDLVVDPVGVWGVGNLDVPAPGEASSQGGDSGSGVSGELGQGFLLVAQSMNIRNVAAWTADNWVVRVKEALQVVQRQRVVPLEVVPFFFIAPSQ